VVLSLWTCPASWSCRLHLWDQRTRTPSVCSVIWRVHPLRNVGPFRGDNCAHREFSQKTGQSTTGNAVAFHFLPQSISRIQRNRETCLYVWLASARSHSVTQTDINLAEQPVAQVMLWPCIREMFDSNLGRDTGYSEGSVSRYFPQFLQQIVCIIARLSPDSFLPNHFQICYLPIIITIDASESEISIL
jgi:hypothetical protein